MDAFEPEVGIAMLELSERLGCTVEYPYDPTCGGPTLTTTGCHGPTASQLEGSPKRGIGVDPGLQRHCRSVTDRSFVVSILNNRKAPMESRVDQEQ